MQLKQTHAHTNTSIYTYKLKCIFENICDDPLEFAFLWHVTRFVFFFCSAACDVWGQFKMHIANGEYICMYSYINKYLRTYAFTFAHTKYAILLHTHTHTPSKWTLRYITHWPHNSCSSQRQRRHRRQQQRLCQQQHQRTADKGSQLGEHSLRRCRRRKMRHLTHLWKSELECAAKLILLECFVV